MTARTRGRGDVRSGVIALAVLVPFVVRAIRALAWSPRGQVAGDDALMDLQVRQAMHWQLLLGVYDRFGWHHPGPAYLYLISFAERLTGPARAAQAQVATAAMIDGLAAAGAVLVVERCFGRRAALGAAVAVTAVSGLLAVRVLGDPWNPNIVILPLVLVGVLCACAMGGSIVALLGAALVGSAVVQADVGTLPLVAAYLVAAASIVFWRRIRSSRRSGSPSEVGGGRSPVASAVPYVLAVSIGLVWLPVLVQQVSSRPGNLTLLERFFTAGHGGISLTFSLDLVGIAEGAAFGLSTPQFSLNPNPGLLRFALIAILAAAVAVLAVAFRSHAASLSLVGLGGIVVSVVAAGRITGMPWEYVLAWAAAPVVVVLIAGAVLVAERTELLDHHGVALIVTSCAVVGLTVVAAASLPQGVVSPDVKVAADVAIAREGTKNPIGLMSYGLGLEGVESGVADQLVMRKVPYAVSPGLRWQYPYSSAGPPTEWEALTEPGKPIPPGYVVMARTPDVVVSIGGRSPPHWMG